MLEAAEVVCKNLGNTFILSVGRNKSLMEKHRKLGWLVDTKPVYEMMKIIK